MQIKAVMETCIYALNLAESERFYSTVLGLQCIEYDPLRHIFYRLGGGMLLVFNPRETSQPGGRLPPHGSIGGGHLAFAVEPAAIDDWMQHLLAHAINIEREIRWSNGARSIYFRDPSQNSLELGTPGLWGLPNPEC